MRKKISVVGYEHSGAGVAQRLAERDYADLVLVDNVTRLAQPVATDLNNAGAVVGYEPRITAAADYADIAGSDIVVVTSAQPEENGHFVPAACAAVRMRAPNAILIVAAEPSDAVCQLAYASTRFPRQRVIGVGAIADSARFRTLVARAAGTSVREVTGMVLGGPGERAVPIVSRSTVAGTPAAALIGDERLEEIRRRTRAAEVPGESRAYARAAAAVEAVDSIVFDQQRVLPCTALCEGEYRVDGLFVAVPVVLGGAGIEEIVQLSIDAEEARALERSAELLLERLGT